MNWITMLIFWLVAAGIIYAIIMWSRKEAERIKTKVGKRVEDEINRTLAKLNRSH